MKVSLLPYSGTDGIYSGGMFDQTTSMNLLTSATPPKILPYPLPLYHLYLETNSITSYTPFCSTRIQMLPKRTLNNFPLKIRYEIFILAMTPPHAEWLDHPIIYLKNDRVRKVVWGDLDPTYHNLLLTDKMCHWTAERALFSHFVFMYAEPLALELPYKLRWNIKHFAYRPDLMHDTSHFFNLIDIRRQLSYLTTVHIVIPQRGERISQRITTDAETLKFIALIFLTRYRVAVVGQTEQDGCWDIESGQVLYSVRNALRGLEGYRHLNMFYKPHGQNPPIEFGCTDTLWTREEDLGLLEDRKPVVSELENMALIPRMRSILSIMSTYSAT